MGLSWRLGVLLVFLLVVGFLVAGSNPAGGTFETPLPGVLPSRWGFTFVRHGGCYAGTEFAGIRIFVRDGFGGSKTYRSELFFDALPGPPATRRAGQTHRQVRAAGSPPPRRLFLFLKLRQHLLDPVQPLRQGRYRPGDFGDQPNLAGNEVDKGFTFGGFPPGEPWPLGVPFGADKLV